MGFSEKQTEWNRMQGSCQDICRCPGRALQFTPEESIEKAQEEERLRKYQKQETKVMIYYYLICMTNDCMIYVKVCMTDVKNNQ